MSAGTGCRDNNLAGAFAQAPGYAPGDQARCGVTRSQARPLIIEWPSHDRGTLESLVEGGKKLVAVRYEGCEMEVLPGCQADGRYRYRGVQPKQDDYTFRHASDLYAKIPLGAASLEAELERHGALKLDMTVVGRYESAEVRLARADLDGDCERATHVITGLSVGAFRLASEGGAAMRGGGRFYGAGAGAGSSAQRGFERSDGDPDACEDGDADGPPSRCRALLRVEVDPIREPEEIAAARARQVCPRGAALVEGGRFRPSVGASLDVADFCLDRAEVTVADYASCAAKGPCSDAPTTARWEGMSSEDAALHGPLCNGDRTARRNHPANCVSWHQADAYCRARGGRLPSEQEWEWAARGGEQERTYAWGEQEPGPRLVNACGKECAKHLARLKGQDAKDMSEEVFPQLYATSDGAEGTARVGGYPGGRGRGRVADLAGNVWEWTASAELTYATSEESLEGWGVAQGGPDTGKRATRGGGFWSASDAEVRVTARKLRDVKDRRPDLGFRCAYDP